MTLTNKTITKKKAAQAVVAKSKKAAVAASANPKKKNPNQPVVAWAFVLNEKCGGKPEYFKDASAAAEFRKQNSLIIKKERRFKSEKALSSFKKSFDVSSPTSVIGTPVRSHGLPKVDASSAERMLSLVTKNMPANCLEFHYNTTSHSPKAAFIIMFKDEKAQQAWCIKPTDVADALKAFGATIPSEIPEVNQALENTDTVFMRDIASIDRNAIARSIGSSKKDGEKSKGFEISLLYTHIDIPYNRFVSEKQEKEWLHDTCILVGETIVSIMNTEAFKRTLERRCQFPKYWAAIMRKDASWTTYPSFMSHPKVKAVEAPQLSTFLIANDAERINAFHWSVRLADRKYKFIKQESPENGTKTAANRAIGLSQLDDDDEMPPFEIIDDTDNDEDDCVMKDDNDDEEENVNETSKKEEAAPESEGGKLEETVKGNEQEEDGEKSTETMKDNDNDDDSDDDIPLGQLKKK